MGIIGIFMDLSDATKTSAEKMAHAEEEALKFYSKLELIGLSSETLAPALMALGTAFASLFVFVKGFGMVATIVGHLGSAISLIGTVLGSTGIAGILTVWVMLII